MSEYLSYDENPFDEFETLGELGAFIYRKFGEDGLLTMLRMGDGCDRDFLERGVEELEQLGLKEVAEIIAAVIADARASADICPYGPGVTNARAWHARRARRGGLRAKLKRA